MRGPEALALEVVERHLQVEAGRPAVAGQAAVGAETQDQAGVAGEGLAGQLAVLDLVEQGEQEQRLVRGLAVAGAAAGGGVEFPQLAEPVGVHGFCRIRHRVPRCPALSRFTVVCPWRGEAGRDGSTFNFQHTTSNFQGGRGNGSVSRIRITITIASADC